MSPIPAPDTADAAASTADGGRFAVRAALAGFGLMFVAAGLLWARVGPTFFYDALAYATGCF